MIGMDYLKMIEFLTKELIRKDDAVNSLLNDIDHQKSIVDRLTKLNDKHLADIIANEDAVGDAEANLHWVEDELKKMTQLKDKYKDELKEMTIEKDHWKAEALEYRNEVEPEWWAKEEKYKAEIERLKSSKNNSIVKIATYMSGTEQEVSDAVDEFNSLFNGKYFTYREWVDDAVYRIDGFISKSKLEDTDMLMDFEIIEELDADEELYRYNEELTELNKELNRIKRDSENSWATEFAYHHLKKEYDSIKDYYEERIAKLQVEINHFKNNK